MPQKQESKFTGYDQNFCCKSIGVRDECKFFFIFLNQSNYDKSTTLEYTSGSQPLVTDDLQNSIKYNLATHSKWNDGFGDPK